MILAISSPGIIPAQLALQHVQDQLKSEWLTAGKAGEDLNDILLSSCHQSSLSGVTHAYFQQSFRGIPVRDGLGSIHLDASGNVQYVNFQFYSEIKQKIKTTSARISPDKARAIAVHATSFSEAGRATATGPAPKLVYVENAAGELVLSYQVELPLLEGTDDRLVYWIDAQNGGEIEHRNRTLYCHFEAEENAAPGVTPTSTAIMGPSDIYPTPSLTAGAPKYYAFPFGVESPADGNRQLLAGNSIIDPIASPMGWHKTDPNPLTPEFGYTQGNNVYAYYAPLSADNPAPSPITRAPFTGTFLSGNVPWPANLNFDYRRNIEQLLANNFIEDAVTNVFVRNNMVHDLLFRYGFDEAAGNFQTTNLSGEGLGNDHVLARTQDGLGVNQASFFTPPDGQNPYMRVFLWDTNLPNSVRDASFDNLILAHEYGHGLSFRLVGGANNTNCLTNYEQGGEGWSDFFGLMMTLTDRNGNGHIDENALGEGIRGIGHYVLTQSPTESGMRPRHYTTNMDCSSGLCNEFTYGDVDQLARPHGVGFLWCTILWDMSWGLINEYGFEQDLYDTGSDAGNIRALKIVVEALKMTACNPSFIDMRDAVLAANDILYAGEGNDVLWAAFARRGLGYSAAPNGEEAFDDPHMRLIKTVDKTEAALGETVTYTLSLTNHTDHPLQQTVVSDQLPANFVATAISDAGTQSADGLVQWPKVTIPKKQTIVRTITGYLDNVAPTTIVADYSVEPSQLLGFVPVGAWLPTSDNPNPHTASTLSWFHLDPNAPVEGSLILSMVLDGTKNNHLSFWHSFDMEPGFDAGVMEILVNGEWQDLGRNIIENGYNSIILDELLTPVGVPVKFSPFSGQRAFSGYSQGYQRCIVDLSIYEGPTLVRFRFGSNPSTDGNACDGTLPGCDGWYIDDVQLLDLQHLPNTACAYSNNGYYSCGDIGALGTVFYPAPAARPAALPHELKAADGKVHIFPNPARDQMTVELPEWGKNAPDELLLLNAQGQIVDRYRLAEGTGKVQLDGSRLPRGLYFLSFQAGGEQQIHRVTFQ